MKVAIPKKDELYGLVDKYFGVIAIVLVFIILVVGLTQFVMPLWKQVREVDVLNVQQTQEELDEAQLFLSQLRQMRNKYEDISYADIQRLQNVLPHGLDKKVLFLQLQEFGKDNDLEVTSLGISGGATGLTDTRRQASTQATDAARVEQAIITMSVNGLETYQSFKDFLTNVEQYAPILELTSIQYPLATTSATFSFTTYYLSG